MANKIQIKRGLFASLPTLSAGELGFSTDTAQLHIGDGTTNWEVVMHKLFGANSILAANADDTPLALTVTEQTIVGRLTGGNIAAVAIGIADNNMLQVDGSPNDNEFARFTAAGIEGLTGAETMAALSGQAAADFSMGGYLLRAGTAPILDDDYVIKSYADALAMGVRSKESCRVLALAGELPAYTAAGSKVGKTLTMDAVGILTIDSVNTVLGDRILISGYTSNGGIYEVTTEGTAGVAAILTRVTDYDEDDEVMAGTYTFITEGTVHADQGWMLSTNNPITVDTTTLTFVQFSQVGGGANKWLSNLEDTVAINKSLLPGTTDTIALGSATKMWSDLYLADGAIQYFGATDQIVHSTGNFNHGSANLQTTGWVGKTTADRIGFGTAGRISFTIGSTADSFMGVARGAAETGSDEYLVTKAYVDELAATADTFLELDDTPAAYTGEAYSLLRVNAAGNAVEFMAIIDGGSF